jgi:hypothetical protein
VAAATVAPAAPAATAFISRVRRSIRDEFFFDIVLSLVASGLAAWLQG